MSLSEQERRLSQLKQLQEQLQKKLLSQLSSDSYDSSIISDEVRREILQSVGMTTTSQSMRPTQEQAKRSVGNKQSPSTHYHPLSPHLQTTETNLVNERDVSMGSQFTAGYSKYPPSPKHDGMSPQHGGSLGHMSHTTSSPGKTDSYIPLLEAWPTSPTATDEIDEGPVPTPSIASTEFLNLPDQSISQMTVKEQGSITHAFRGDGQPCNDNRSNIVGTNEGYLGSGWGQDGVDSCNATLNISFGDKGSPSQMAHTHTADVCDVQLGIGICTSKQHSPHSQGDVSPPHHFVKRVSASPHQQGRSPSPPISEVMSPKTGSCRQCFQLSSGIDQLLAENSKWKLECSKLEGQVDENMSLNELLQEKMSRLQRRMSNFQKEHESREQLVSMLQSRVSSLSCQLRDRDEGLGKMKEKVEDLEVELGSVSREKKDLKEILHQTNSAMEDLKRDNSHLEANLISLESHLGESEDEIGRLQASLNIMKERENQFQSTIRAMEDEIRSLRHVNNRLQSQATHFPLSDPSPPLFNISDETKLVSPRRKQTEDHALSRPRSSKHVSESAMSDGQRPLTRRKWLETSEGGFIFGSPSLPKESELKEDKENNPSYSPRTSLTPRGVAFSARREYREEEQPHPHQFSPVESVLQSIKDGNVTGNEYRGRVGRSLKSPRETIEERVEKRMRIIAEAEKKLANLQKEKEQLEHLLQRAPPTSKVTVQSKQAMMNAESRLDDVIKEIGATRMILRGSPSWKK